MHGEEDPPAQERKANQGNCAPTAFQMMNTITWIGTYIARWSQNH
jgi:hypothetical protein